MPQPSPFLTTTTLTLASLLAVGCATAPPPVQVYTPRFGFAYPAANEAPAGDITIAIIRPVDVNEANIQAKKDRDARIASFRASGWGVDGLTSKYEKLDEAFRSSMVAQLQELFNAKGFKQRGPFDDLNGMTFPDKKGSDLTLTTQVGIGIALPQKMRQTKPNLVGSDVHVIVTSGPCSASGFVSFVILEPLSGEKLWVKKVDVPPVQANCSGEAEDDQFLANGYAYVLEQVYPVVMKTAWDYLSSEELAVLKKQAQELRTKKVY